jgi:hypothetical protein
MPPARASLRSAVLALAALLLTMTPAPAQQPKLEMHRVEISNDDGSGWHRATSSKGSFSISLPIPFNDFTTHAATGEASHVIGAKSAEGIKYSATELPITAKTPSDLQAIAKSFTATVGNKVSDLSHTKKDATEALSFTVSNATAVAHFRYVKTQKALYTLTLECPKAYAEIASATKDKFFASLKIKERS